MVGHPVQVVVGLRRRAEVRGPRSASGWPWRATPCGSARSDRTGRHRTARPGLADGLPGSRAPRPCPPSCLLRLARSRLASASSSPPSASPSGRSQPRWPARRHRSRRRTGRSRTACSVGAEPTWAEIGEVPSSRRSSTPSASFTTAPNTGSPPACSIGTSGTAIPSITLPPVGVTSCRSTSPADVSPAPRRHLEPPRTRGAFPAGDHVGRPLRVARQSRRRRTSSPRGTA